MTGSHVPEHDELLASLLLGEEVTAQERATLAGCPQCSAALSELEDVRARLDVLGAAERATALAEADAGGPAPGEEAAQRALEAALRGPDRTPEGPAFGPAWILALSLAAAAILVFTVLRDAWVVPDADPADPGGSVFLSSSEIELLSPVGSVREWGTFAWRYDVRVGATFTIRIWDADAEAADPVLTVPQLDEDTWTPTTDDLEKIPKRIRWTVLAIDATQRSVESEPASAWLQ